MKAFTRIVRPGSIHLHQQVDVFCKIEWDGNKLSITGVEGPKHNGDCHGGCGQIDVSGIENLSEHWTAEMLTRLKETWDRWHLNDMRAGCEHQRDWPISKKLVLRPFTWGPKYHEMRKQALEGTMSETEYRLWPETVKKVERLTIGYPRPKHISLLDEDEGYLLHNGLVVDDTHKTYDSHEKAAGWVHPQEHPEGLLAKPCPTCGYKYGSAWLHEDVPEEVLEFLVTLPETTIHPAWV